MKKSFSSASVMLLATLLASSASAAVISGNINLTLTGTLRVAGRGNTGIDCNAHAFLIPATGGAVTVGGALLAPWLRGADQSANAKASWGFSTAGSSVTGVRPTPLNAGTVTGFTCKVVIPYTFTNAAAAGQTIAITYSVKATDPGGFVSSGFGQTYVPPSYPGGKTQQVLTIVAPPASPGTINLSAAPKI